jgi:hypothetical protein
MAEITRRKEVSYRWICTQKDRLEEIDAKIEELVGYQSQLSSYVEHKFIRGLDCLTLGGKFKYLIKELRDERKSLWRRVRHEIEEEVTTDAPQAEPVEQEKYVSPFMPVNMERVL